MSESFWINDPSRDCRRSVSCQPTQPEENDRQHNQITVSSFRVRNLPTEDPKTEQSLGVSCEPDVELQRECFERTPPEPSENGGMHVAEPSMAIS